LDEKKEKDVSDIAGRNAVVENEQLKLENTQLRSQLDAVKKALVKAQDTIEVQERARMIPVLKAGTTMTDAEIHALDTSAMHELCDNLRILRLPVASVKPGSDEDLSSVLTVPNKFRFGRKS